MKVAILNDLGGLEPSLEAEAAKQHAPWEFVWERSATPEQLASCVAVISAKHHIDSADLEVLCERIPMLQMVSLALTGFNGISLDAFKERAICPWYCPGYSTQAVVELNLAYVLAIYRWLWRADYDVVHGDWQTPPGFNLRGRTVGILGTGRTGLGSAQAFSERGCPVLGWSRTEYDEFRKQGGVYVDNLEELLAVADIVLLHLPLNDETHQILNRDRIATMKQGAVLCNTSRSQLVDYQALAEALESGALLGAGIDVFDTEPAPEEDPIRRLDSRSVRIVRSPHIGFQTDLSYPELARMVVENLHSFERLEDSKRCLTCVWPRVANKAWELLARSSGPAKPQDGDTSWTPLPAHVLHEAKKAHMGYLGTGQHSNSFAFLRKWDGVERRSRNEEQGRRRFSDL